MGESFSLAFVALDSAGSVIERSDVLTYSFGGDTVIPAEATTEDPLVRAEGTALRMMSWNVGTQAIVDRLDSFQRVLAALEPDVLLLDELPADVEPATVLDALDLTPLPEGAAWNVAIGPGGGRQRVAVASRFPVALAEPLARIPYPSDFPAWLGTIEREWIREDLASAASDGVSSAGFLIELDRRRLLAVPLDLQCCGRLGEPEDTIRQVQAKAIHDEVAAALPRLDVDGVILAGDLNLVASRTPLGMLRSGLDVDGSDLAVLDAIQLDGRSAATWGFDGVFPTSRLDYFLYSDSELLPLGAFVFDVRDLRAEWQHLHGLTAADARLSGHLPIVVDLRWIYPAEEQ